MKRPFPGENSNRLTLIRFNWFWNSKSLAILSNYFTDLRINMNFSLFFLSIFKFCTQIPNPLLFLSVRFNSVRIDDIEFVMLVENCLTMPSFLYQTFKCRWGFDYSFSTCRIWIKIVKLNQS
jgi:hypothetical protein